jgi:hypothetical protein
MPTAEVAEKYNKDADEVKVEYLLEGTMSWDSFIRYKCLSVEYVTRQNVQAIKANQAERREILKNDNHHSDDYAVFLYEKIGGSIIAESVYTTDLEKRLKLPVSVIDQSMKVYLSQPEKSKELAEKMEAIKKSINGEQKLQDLDEEKILELC